MPRKQGVKSLRPPLACAGCAIIVMILGVLASTVGYDLLSSNLSQALRNAYVLDGPNAAGLSAWSSGSPLSSPRYTDFYIYNVTNPIEASAGAPINVEEIGPLTYTIRTQRYDLSWDPEEGGDMLTFREVQYFVAVDAATLAMEDMVIYTVNLPLLAMLQSPAAKANPAGFMTAFNSVQGESQTSPFISRRIRDVLWGYTDALLSALHTSGLEPNVPMTFPGIVGNVSLPTPQIPTSRMYTGKYASELEKSYAEWQAYDTFTCCTYGPCGTPESGGGPVTLWETDEATAVGGTSGEQFHQSVSSSETLHVHSAEMGVYRHWPLTSDGATSTLQGLSTTTFSLPPFVLGNSSVSSYESQAYGISGLSGLLNESMCWWNAPVFYSRPRFVGVSVAATASVTGVPPAAPGCCDTYFSVEPYSGISLDYHWRLALNSYVTATSLGPNSFFAAVKSSYVPIAWMDRYSTLSSSDATTLRNLIVVKVDAMLACRWGGVALAGLAALFTGWCLYLAWQRKVLLDRFRELQAAEYYAAYYRPAQSFSVADSGYRESQPLINLMSPPNRSNPSARDSQRGTEMVSRSLSEQSLDK